MLRVSAYSNSQLLAVLRGLRNLDRETKKHLRANLKKMVQTEWQAELAARASTRTEQRVLVGTARAAVSDQNVRLKSASIGRSLSGGLKPSESYGPVEFGAPKRVKTVRSTRRGTPYRTTRDVNAPMRAPNRRGYVVFPTLANIVPRVLAMYTQTFMRAIHEALEGKQ